MANPYFQFKQFTVFHDRCAMKVTTDSCLFGAWAASLLRDAQVNDLLDIGTGTGLLPLMIAQQNEVMIDAVELDAEAATQARENVDASPWKERIHIINADIRSFASTRKYDSVISNPPFYEGELTGPQAARNRAHHSSDLTLAQVIECIDHHLSENGSFFLLLPYKRLAEARKRLQDAGLRLTRIYTVRNSPAHLPFRVLLAGSRKEGAITEDAIDIRDTEGEYTLAFISLLKDYYLYL